MDRQGAPEAAGRLGVLAAGEVTEALARGGAEVVRVETYPSRKQAASPTTARGGAASSGCTVHRAMARL